jgi:hypothetical protein
LDFDAEFELAHPGLLLYYFLLSVEVDIVMSGIQGKNKRTNTI